MPNPARALLLGPLLKGVSRSFYLTLRVLPSGMRDPIGLAHLSARAADTIADTSLIPPGQRLELLLSLRSQVNGASDEGALTRMQAGGKAGRGKAGQAGVALMKALPRGIFWVEYFLTTGPAHCVASALASTIADFRAAAS
jgi:phytoene/squalene synthetase